MHSIPPCATRQTLYPIGPSSMQVGVTKFNFFEFFNFSTCRSFLTFYSSNPYRPSLVASNTLSDAQEPLFTSYLCGRCPKTSLSPNPDFWRRNLGIPGTPHLHLFHQHVNMATRAMQDPIGQWYADMDMCIAIRARAMRALLFSVFCGHLSWIKYMF